MQSVASATVTPASSSRRASGYGERVENSTPGSRVATVPESRSASTSASVEVGAVVDAAAPELDGQLDARARGRAGWRARRSARPGRAPGREDRPRLVGVEGRRRLAEHVDPARVRRAGVEHRAGDQGDVARRVVGVLGRHDVRAEERGLRR